MKYICDQIAVMYLGTIVEMAETEAIFTMACHPYTRMLLLALQPTKEEGGIGPLLEEKACQLTAPVLTKISPSHFVAAITVMASNVKKGTEISMLWKDRYRLKRKEDLLEKWNQLSLEKGDVTAMMLAALITLFTVVLIVGCVFTAINWFLFLR